MPRLQRACLLFGCAYCRMGISHRAVRSCKLCVLIDLQPESASLPKVSPLRSHLRDVLKRCGKNYTGGDS